MIATPAHWNLDIARAPVVFGWLLYRHERFAGAIHLETLYRLDRFGGTEGAASLQPSPYFGQSIDMLRALLHAQQHTRLPHTPTECRWLGPQLISEVNVASARLRSAAQAASFDDLPAERNARLALARALAQRLLQGPQRT